MKFHKIGALRCVWNGLNRTPRLTSTSYLADELRFRSALSSSRGVPRKRLSTVGYRAFPVGALCRRMSQQRRH